MARDRQLDAREFIARCGDKRHAVRVQRDILCGQVGRVLVAGEGHARTLGVSEHRLRRRIVQIDHALVADREQDRLGLTVCLHGLVEIQVILGQVGERAHCKADAVHAVEHE